MRHPAFRLLLGALAIGVCVYLGRNYFGELDRLRDTEPLPALAVLLLYLSARFVNSEILRALLRRIGHSIGRAESFFLAMLVSYTNLLVPRAGLGTPALYLKSTQGVSYARFAALQFPIAACALIAVGSAGLLAQAQLDSVGAAAANPALKLLFAGAVLAGTVSSFVRIPLPASRSGRIVDFFRRMSDAWELVWQSQLLVARILSLQVLSVVLRAARLYAAMWALGIEASPFGVLLASALGDLTLFVSITPAGLGLREAAITYGAAAAGITPEFALSAAVLDRLIWTPAIVVAAQIGLWRVIRPRLGAADA